MMRPEVMASVSTFKRYANANAAAFPLVDKSVTEDPGIYPPPEQRERLTVQLADSIDQTRAITRVWQKFKTGQ
jgi:putrescine transport system substrate-binding protein